MEIRSVPKTHLLELSYGKLHKWENVVRLVSQLFGLLFYQDRIEMQYACLARHKPRKKHAQNKDGHNG